jgi:hypothetical protein
MMNRLSVDLTVEAMGRGLQGSRGPRGKDLVVAFSGCYRPLLVPLAHVDSVVVSPADQPFTVWQGITIFTVCVSLMTTSNATPLVFEVRLPTRSKSCLVVGTVMPCPAILRGEARVDPTTNDTSRAIVTIDLAAGWPERVDTVVGFYYDTADDGVDVTGGAGAESGK